MNWSLCIEAPGYWVSDEGHVRNKHGRILRGVTYPNGYRGVRFGRVGKTHLVHRLVLRAFVGPAKDGEDANHKNGVRSDNRLANLEWVSHSDNIKHAHTELKRKAHAWSTPVLVGAVRFNNMHEAAKFLGVAHGSVRSALVNKHRCRGQIVEAA